MDKAEFWGKAGKMYKSKTHKQIFEVEGVKIYMSETEKICFSAAPDATLAILLSQIFEHPPSSYYRLVVVQRRHLRPRIWSVSFKLCYGI